MSVCAEIYFQQTWHAYQTLSQQFNSLQGKIFLCVFCCLMTTSSLVLVISYLLVSSAKCCLLSLSVFSSPTLALRVNRSSRPPSMKTIQPPPSHSATLIFIKILIKHSGTLGQTGPLCQTGPFAVRKKGPRWVFRGFGAFLVFRWVSVVKGCHPCTGRIFYYERFAWTCLEHSTTNYHWVLLAAA